MRKLVLFAAPSGAGKTTIVRRLLDLFDQLSFSVSATTRPRRAYEEEGKDYYFLDVPAFKRRVDAGDFVEWEEVYPGTFYGTLKSELERLWASGKDIVFDVDVQGALRIKEAYPDNSLAIFVKPPSKEVLFQRLQGRKTESPKTLQERMAKAEEELLFENKFDYVLVNDALDEAVREAEQLVRRWIASS
ncbi:MAG: guanylate kinase [Saprospiraceae bacterium]|jgi:guanylate kinase